MGEKLVSGKETPGLRHKYRLQCSSDLDYGNRWEQKDTSENNFTSENYLVSKSFVDGLFENNTTCKTCIFLLKFEEVGHSAIKTIIAKCTNKFCDSDNSGIFPISY